MESLGSSRLSSKVSIQSELAIHSAAFASKPKLRRFSSLTGPLRRYGENDFLSTLFVENSAVPLEDGYTVSLSLLLEMLSLSLVCPQTIVPIALIEY